jgi:hypothetical protein
MLSRPRPVWVAGQAENVHVAAPDFQGEQNLDPPRRDRAVHVEEVHGHHARGMGTKEASPRSYRHVETAPVVSAAA